MTINHLNNPSFKSILSHLSLTQAKQLLGHQAQDLLNEGGEIEIDIDTDIKLDDKSLSADVMFENVCLYHDSSNWHQLGWQCTCKRKTCFHLAAVLSLLLEEKTPLGLAQEPDQLPPNISASDEELISQAINERMERAKTEKMLIIASDPKQLWSDYSVTNKRSGKSYRVALRGWDIGQSFCSCPDFRKNTLGTCKHILHTIAKTRKRFPASVKNSPFIQKEPALHLQYGTDLELRIIAPEVLDPGARTILAPFLSTCISDYSGLVKMIQKLDHIGQTLLIYPDAEEFLQRRLLQQRLSKLSNQIRENPSLHPLRTSLLNAKLLPYQLDGIAFAAGAGRAILADEMGLGKTIQAIGLAEFLAREMGIKRVLVIMPASLKAQWKNEIGRFCARSSLIIQGTAVMRLSQYQSNHFFTLCNYEQVLRDAATIHSQSWDLIILDEGQRIKNWQTKTSKTIKTLRSQFALVLTGTPLENRIDDLYSIVEFIDDRRLGADFRFYHRYKVVDEKGKVIGYQNLTELNHKLKPVLLRRTRHSVNQQLPERKTEIIRISPTQEQLDIHQGFKKTISSILAKRYITEMDLLRLQKALLSCRMAANSTFLITKKPPGFSSKLAELDIILQRLCDEEDRKILLFSEWTTMLNLIEPILDRLGMDYVRLDGKVVQKKRQQIINQFQTQTQCKVFLSTNAGTTGLNLQAANTVINVDLPWNPAILEQRIARAYRMGQKQAIQVYILVTEKTLEENLLATLSAKKELAVATLDPDADIDSVDLLSGIEELKRRLELLIGEPPKAPLSQDMAEQQSAQFQQEQIAASAGTMLMSAFEFMRQLLPEQTLSDADPDIAELLQKNLHRSATNEQNGEIKLSITLPDEKALTALSNTMAQLLAFSKQT